MMPKGLLIGLVRASESAYSRVFTYKLDVNTLDIHFFVTFAHTETKTELKSCVRRRAVCFRQHAANLVTVYKQASREKCLLVTSLHCRVLVR